MTYEGEGERTGEAVGGGLVSTLFFASERPWVIVRVPAAYAASRVDARARFRVFELKAKPNEVPYYPGP